VYKSVKAYTDTDNLGLVLKGKPGLPGLCLLFLCFSFNQRLRNVHIKCDKQFTAENNSDDPSSNPPYRHHSCMWRERKLFSNVFSPVQCTLTSLVQCTPTIQLQLYASILTHSEMIKINATQIKCVL